jgi:hypothetical protein
MKVKTSTRHSIIAVFSLFLFLAPSGSKVSATTQTQATAVSSNTNFDGTPILVYLFAEGETVVLGFGNGDIFNLTGSYLGKNVGGLLVNNAGVVIGTVMTV